MVGKLVIENLKRPVAEAGRGEKLDARLEDFPGLRELAR